MSFLNSIHHWLNGHIFDMILVYWLYVWAMKILN